MPVVSLTLEDTNRTILANAYSKIVQDIVDTIKIPYGTLVLLHKDIEVSLTDNKANATANSQANLPSTVANRRVQATISEDFNEDELTTTAVHQPSAYPIFQDHDVGVQIFPIYVKSDITIEFTYISPSKTEAARIRDDIRLRLSQTRNIDLHEIEYSILIPEIVEDFIADVYDLKNRLVPQPLEDYFREHSTKRIYPITDMGNTSNTKLAVHEKQVRIVGVFDMNSMPEKLDHDNENNNYRVKFSYKLSMDVPRAIGMRYPVMICNRPLPAKYIQFIEDHKVHSKEERKKELNYTSSLRSLSHFEAHRQLENRVDINLPINIPGFDEFHLRQGHKGYGIVVSFLSQVDETDKKGLFNLTDIDPYHIPPYLLDYIRTTERRYMTRPYGSFMYIGLHQEGRHFDNSVLEIDADLNVRSKVPLSLMKPVRITISIIIDLSYLEKDALERLFDNCELYYVFLAEYLNAYNNFKTEQDQILNDNTFYRDLLFTINRYLNMNRQECVVNILKIILQDLYVSRFLGRVLVSGAMDVVKTLAQQGIATVNPKTFEITLLGGKPGEAYISPEMEPTKTDVDRLVMKTVMQTQVDAYRMDN